MNDFVICFLALVWLVAMYFVCKEFGGEDD